VLTNVGIPCNMVDEGNLLQMKFYWIK